MKIKFTMLLDDGDAVSSFISSEVVSKDLVKESKEAGH